MERWHADTNIGNAFWMMPTESFLAPDEVAQRHHAADDGRVPELTSALTTRSRLLGRVGAARTSAVNRKVPIRPTGFRA